MSLRAVLTLLCALAISEPSLAIASKAKTAAKKKRSSESTRPSSRPQDDTASKDFSKEPANDVPKDAPKGVSKEAGRDVNKISSKTTHAETVKDDYQLTLGPSLSYLTWEERPQFDRWGTAHAHIYTPCIGVVFNYANATYDWAAGGYVGVGKGEVQFPSGFYDRKASVTMLSAFGSGLVQLTDRAAFGLEAMMIDLSLTANTSANTKTSFNNQEAALLAVGRFRFSSLELKFKGGTILGGTSAMWGIELAYPLWLF